MLKKDASDINYVNLNFIKHNSSILMENGKWQMTIT